MKKSKKLSVSITIAVAVLIVAIAVASIANVVNNDTFENLTTSIIKQTDVSVDSSQFFDQSVVYQLPNSVSSNDELSLIVQMKGDTLLDVYEAENPSLTFSEYYATEDARKFIAETKDESYKALQKIKSAGVSYQYGAEYSTVIKGFEIIVKARDFEKVCSTLGSDYSVMIGEEYHKAETEVVENSVSVYDTGIFDSSDFGYDGTGIVVAVLDTGLDYYHTAFSLDNFTADRSKLGLTFDEVSAVVNTTTASQMQAGLTASDVYINEKVPFGFDYADGDSEVYPINNHHGTHVSGVIAGKDDVITGVAPNAQLVEMKIFSDTEETAHASWILRALEDCVVLGVDIINMSIGTSCGFSRETDKEQLSGVYDRIRETGISLVVAASNSFSSTYGSQKNGNLGLTSNPDTGTVGSPSTYESAISVASVNGAPTPYILYNNQIIYFIESSDRVSEEKVFVEDLLKDNETELEIEYVTIPGVGRRADYTGIDVKNKIALIARGSNTFEEKANIAEDMGARGVIIYNNVSGDIKMNVGDTKIAVCSISQDDGEMLAKAKTGVIKVGSTQACGPYMSDFSSWGPTPDLKIKPEITAHGGMILSAIPGQEYDRISGTSMATPNLSGVTALLRQYVKDAYPNVGNNPVELTAFINRLLMSTADIILNTNGLPYSVRKQGAGLANLENCGNSGAYVLTYNDDGSVMDKSKIELGADTLKTGEYTLDFAIDNFGNTNLNYDLSAFVMTEGVSETKTNDGKTTVTEDGYSLDGASVKITSVKGGTLNGNNISVNAGSCAQVTVTITLSEEDKNYLDTSFANGMYVEGFIVLKCGTENGVDLSVPYLAFYGDWTTAPLFDLDYFETNKDELDDSIDLLDKTLPDAYATRPIGGISDDYVSYLGSFYYQQNPDTKMISADRKYISLTNQTDGVNSLKYVWAGLLRSAEKILITITNDATGEVVFERVETDIRKSYGDGGSLYPANVDIGFSAIDENLKNNSTYTVTLKGLLDYEDGGADTNLKNTFTFPITIDFSAPTLTDCEFYTEYDRSEKKTRLFAKMSIYDNHYSMAMLPGYVGLNNLEAMFINFERYLTPIYSEFNSTSYVIYELTDYIYQIKSNAYNKNTFSVVLYDYALNQSTYEIELPDNFTDFYFTETEVTLSPNEVYTLSPNVYPNIEWAELLEFSSTNTTVARVVNNKVIALAPGKSVIYASAMINGVKKSTKFNLTVLSPEDDGYRRIDPPVVDEFELSGYYTDKAYYYVDSTEREIGTTGDTMMFHNNNYSLSMFPSEAVTLIYVLTPYFPNATTIAFESSNSSIVTVDEFGKITAMQEGYASITVNVLKNGENTYYSKSISVTVKDPFITTGPSLTHYFGNGGLVTFPTNLALTEIGQFAFSNFDYVPKDEGDEISDEDPETTKMWYIGDDTITEVIIPEGIEKIGPYAFANLTALTKVKLPSTLKNISYGAFYGCTSLTEVEGIGNVKFINQNAFANCALSGDVVLTNAIAVADYSFAYNTKLEGVTLSENTQSIGAYAFIDNTSLDTLTIEADKLKIGQYAFSGCSSLTSVSVNTAVIPAFAFNDCKKLQSVTIGKDVAVIGEYAFRNTAITTFTVAEGNSVYKSQTDKPYLLNSSGDTILAVAPSYSGALNITNSNITTIGYGAFSGNANITSVNAPSITKIESYAFSECSKLSEVTFGSLTLIGDYAFCKTALTQTPSFENVTTIGNFAFAGTRITSVSIPDNITIGNNAFEECKQLKTVEIGNSVTVGEYAFRYNRENNFTYGYEDLDAQTRIFYFIYTCPVTSLTIGNDVVIEKGAFTGFSTLTEITLGNNAVIGEEGFYNACLLEEIDLSKALSIGKNAFSGDVLYAFNDQDLTDVSLDEDGYYRFRYYASSLKEVDLSSATEIGEGAFAYCHDLTTVTLNPALTEIPANAFDQSHSLTTINLENVEVIGDNAFVETALNSATLTSIVSVGNYAFLESNLTSITLGNDVETVGEGAFSYSDGLTTVVGIANLINVGDYAFAYTKLTDVDLTNAVKLGTHAFMKENATPITVTLGTSLTTIGDNPFANCILNSFSKKIKTTFNNVDYYETIYNYDVSETVKIIDGSVYRVVPNGLEMITYAGNGGRVTVADDTVRISALAFASYDVTEVVLPYTVSSIGHKAFYSCDKLNMVVFASYDAPVLEEEYDVYYWASAENFPVPETLSGLGIVKFNMWNLSSFPSNVFYGANFVNYVGKVEDKLIMVRPSNGQNYDSFIFNQYFDFIIDGASSADDVTLEAISAINALPDTVALSDKKAVEFARLCYNKISSTEQKALVTNYAVLTQAEKRIADLEYLANGNQDEPEVTPPEEPKQVNLGAIIGGVVGGVGGVALIVGLYFLIRYLKKKNKGKSPTKKENKEPVITEETTLSEEIINLIIEENAKKEENAITEEPDITEETVEPTVEETFEADIDEDTNGENK